MDVLPLFSVLLAFITGVRCGETYDNGYWTPTTSTTAWWTPTTTSYWSYYTPYTTTTTCYTQEQGVVTVTSLVPYPVTSILVSYVCEECENNHQTTEPVLVGTTTETLYTTTTPCPAQTTTSNGFVYVVMDTGSYCNGVTAASTTTGVTNGATVGPSASVQFQLINGLRHLDPNVWLLLSCATICLGFSVPVLNP